MDLIQIFDNRKRLDEHFAAVELKRRHPHLRIDGAKLRLSVEAALLLQMDGDHVGGEPFEVERDPYPIGRRRTEKSVERHDTSLPTAISLFSRSGTTSSLATLAALILCHELGRASRQLVHGTVEGGAIG